MQKRMNNRRETFESGSSESRKGLARLPTIAEVRQWRYPKVNAYFTAICFAAPPIGGSIVSFVYNGGALWCLLEVIRGRYKLPRELHFIAMTAALYAYGLAMILAAAVNSNLDTSIPQLVGIASLLLFPFSYSIWRVSEKDEIMRICMAACAAACLGGLLLALVQVHLLSVDRAVGGAGNALVFSNVIALAGGVSLIGAFKHAGKERSVYLAAFLASAVAVVYSASRGPLIVVVASAIIVSLIYARGRAMRTTMFVAAAALVAVALLLASGVTPLSDRFGALFSNWSDIAEDGNFSSSVGIRVALWQIGLDLWLENPLFGYGAGELQTLIHQRLTAQYGITSGFSHFHNVFLNTLVEGGLVALVALLAMIAVPSVTALQVLSAPASEAERFGATLLLLILSMFLITGMTNLVLRHDIMDAVLMICLVVGLYLAAGSSARSIADIAEPQAETA